MRYLKKLWHMIKSKRGQDMNVELYWNDKHPKGPVVYNGRAIRGYSKRIPVDVRSMIFEDDHVLKHITDKLDLKERSNDEKALICQQWAVKHIKYVGDKKSTGLDECWQYPNETAYTHKGDCEDGAILIASLMLNAGVPAWRVRCTAGLVSSGKGAATGGHAYVTYCREEDNNWVVLDWCYLEDSKVPVRDKPLFKDKPNYKEVWFSFNHIYSWTHKGYVEFKDIKEIV